MDEFISTQAHGYSGTSTNSMKPMKSVSIFVTALVFLYPVIMYSLKGGEYVLGDIGPTGILGRIIDIPLMLFGLLAWQWPYFAVELAIYGLIWVISSSVCNYLYKQKVVSVQRRMFFSGFWFSLLGNITGYIHPTYLHLIELYNLGFSLLILTVFFVLSYRQELWYWKNSEEVKNNLFYLSLIAMGLVNLVLPFAPLR